MAHLVDFFKAAVIHGLIVVDAMLRFVLPRRGSPARSMDGLAPPDSGSMLCVFAHFDRQGVVDDYVVHYLAALADLGCVIVFASAAGRLDDESIGKIRPYCVKIIVRDNAGYDFASWRDGLAVAGDLSRYDRVILANDSVYGPLRDLAQMFRTLESRDAAVWGITDSLRYGRHLQSYFLVFERTVATSATFRQFWRELPDYRFKHSVIMQCEVGLSKRLARAGFKLAALCEYETMAGELSISGAPVNATLFEWRLLLQEYGCPFIKVQLLRDNPKGLKDLEDWAPVIQDLSDYDTGLIHRHLERIRG